jgi:hypothetical protein
MRTIKKIIFAAVILFPSLVLADCPDDTFVCRRSDQVFGDIVGNVSQGQCWHGLFRGCKLCNPNFDRKAACNATYPQYGGKLKACWPEERTCVEGHIAGMNQTCFREVCK